MSGSSFGKRAEFVFHWGQWEQALESANQKSTQLTALSLFKQNVVQAHEMLSEFFSYNYVFHIVNTLWNLGTHKRRKIIVKYTQAVPKNVNIIILKYQCDMLTSNPMRETFSQMADMSTHV